MAGRGASRGKNRYPRWLLLFAATLSVVVGAATFCAQAPAELPPELSPDLAPSAQERALLPTWDQVREGLEEVERKEASRERELATPQARQLREESRLAFAGLDADESEQLLSSLFSSQLGSLNADTARVLSDAQLINPLPGGAATVKVDGEGMLLDSSIPLRAKDEAGDLKKADLTLEGDPGGFEPKNPLANVNIPRQAGGPIAVGESGLAVTPPASEASEGRRYGDKNIFYPHVLTDTDRLVAPVTGGVETLDLLRSARSPETLEYAVRLPGGAQLKADGSGGAEVLRGGSPIAHIPPPTAVDAQGTNVPVHLTVDGENVVLNVAHGEGDFAYPILVDPSVLQDWYYWSWANGYGTEHLTNGSWWWGQGSNTNWLHASTYCIYTCWGYRGLYVSTESGTLSANSEGHGHWNYTAPNAPNAYITRASIAPFVRDNHGNCPRSSYPQPHDYDGFWDGANWTFLVTNGAEDGSSNLGAYDGQQWGYSLLIGMGTTGNTVEIPCWRDIYAGGVALWLDDWQSPTLDSLSGVPSSNEWVSDKDHFTITATAHDPGLGIQNILLTPQGRLPIPETPEQSVCAGVKGSLCPNDHSAHFELTGESFDQGETTAQVSSFDPTRKYSNTRSFPIKVDWSKPKVALSGQLARVTKTEVGLNEGEPNQAKGDDELSLSVYNLNIEAQDGEITGDPKDKRSGVKNIEIYLDESKTPLPVSWEAREKCPEPGPDSSCPMSKTYPLHVSELEAGEHELTVKAPDFAGNVGERHIQFEYIPATGMKDEYVTQYFPLPDGEGNEADEEHPRRPELAVNVMNGNLVYRQRDIDIESTAGIDLEVERFYNSMLPESESTEWGKGWTLAETPKLEPKAEEPAPTKAKMVQTSGALQGSVGLPTETNQEMFDTKLQATVTKKSGGGYMVTDESGASDSTLNFDSTGKTQALTTEGYAKVNYEYEEGDLSGIAVEDPATYNADSAEIEELESGESEESEGGSSGPPSFVRSFGSYGSGNGQLNNPGDVARDAEGNLWVTDWGNDRIEEFDSEGNHLSEFGESGSGNGQLNHPLGLAIDAEGDLWVVDHSNNRVEQFSPEGEYLSKFGTYGSSKGQFNGPEGIAIGPSGTIWVSDASRVQTFTQQGEATGVFAGHGTGEGQVGEPAGVDVDSEGNVWVADWGNNRVSVFSEEGEFRFQFGSYGSGDGQFEHPASVAIDSAGDAWVGDYEGNRIEKFSPSGEYLEAFGSPGSGPGEFDFGYPTGIAAGPNGNIWVADTGNDRIQQWGASVAHRVFDEVFHQGVIGEEGAEEGQLEAPSDVARDSEGNLWVTDWGNDRIEEFDPEGNYLSQFGESGSGNGQLDDPSALAIDAEGDIWVVDHHNNRIEQFSPEGEYLSKFGTYGSSKGQFNGPEGIAIGPSGTIWVSDASRVQTFTQAGEATGVFAGKGTGEGQVGGPAGIDIGPGGDVWVADCANDRISVFAAGGEFIRQFGSAGSDSGQFSCPDAIDVDDEGHVWVGDLGNDRIDLFEEDGELVMQFGESGSGAEQLDLSYPTGIASDEDGLLWIADSGNHRVQEWLAGHVSETEEEVPTEDDAKVEVDTQAGLVASVSGEEAGANSYEHEGNLLTSYSGPNGKTTYEYDGSERLKKVSLPNETWGEVAYFEDGRVEAVTVSVEGGEAKKTTFSYEDEPQRRTTVNLPNDPTVIYDIAEDGSVFKWSNVKEPPELVLSGSLHVEREKDTISTGAYNLEAYAHSYEGLSSLEIITNGDTLIAEKTCEECPELSKEWVTETWEHPPGHLQVEVVATDSNDESTTERFWVNIPYTPPPDPEADEPPHFSEVLKFHEEYGLEKIFPVSDEFELDDRIFDVIGGWHNPHTPLGEVARATDARWGVPLNPQEAAEMEYREWYIGVLESEIDDWGFANFPGTYAGYEVDHAAGGIFRIGFTEDQQQRVSEFIEQVDPPAADRIQSFLYTPTRSLQSLEGYEPEVANVVQEDAQLSDLVAEVGLDDDENAVVIGTPHVNEVEQRLTQLLGSVNGVKVEYQPDYAELQSGRNRWSGRMLAGDRIVTEWEDGAKTGCTAAFGAYEDRNRRSDGNVIRARFLLSAGHCAPLDQEVSRTSEGGPPYALNKGLWNEVGHVTRNVYDVPPNFVDSLAIRLEAEGVAPNQIYGHDGRRPAIEAPEVAHRGERLCMSGAESNKVSCGKVVGIKHVYYNEEDRTIGLLKVDGFKSVQGDSGAPVWSARGGASVGILSGRVKNASVRFVLPLLNTPTGHGRNGNGKILGALNASGMGDLHVISDGS